MKVSQVAGGAKFQIGTKGNTSGPVFTKDADGTATDDTFAVHRFPGEMPCELVVDDDEKNPGG